ncbi:molybdopterin-guanine dinucleotide biosynthesis protein B [Zavarzinia compransoris]|uniref:Molybdopterin-guanine dinucleotide biosynthesis protein B n=1 Tax=Zavarzinia compransoris TaxID=1264899 RepID=A0A317E7T8_9PROT|nr:molybdopterin-guanine dinucleotide biosynthesis protein B [Zavarzinia compransoris]PWR23198.1 molybdopterin-guanine dinucleotide biosynthesis protein B [Zavarzinia compransoris]TDP46243.1 molybdopterin guanine dinucleotide biosynthesis accessory protein MobB [Zavarzinia compransoris]
MTPAPTKAKVIGFAGWSGSGKTTLVTRLIPALIATGRTVSTVKHAHHDFDVDQPGKDSHDHRLAGAAEVLVASSRRFALMHEYRGAPELGLAALLDRLAPVDVVIVEGFKRDPVPKIEVHRPEVGKPLLQPDDPHIVAVASPAPLPGVGVPHLPLDDIGAIVAFLVARGLV